MLFNSYAFLAVFLPAALAGFFVLRALVTIGWAFFRMRNTGAIADVLTGLAGANVFRRRAYPFVDLNDPRRVRCAETDFLFGDGAHPDDACTAKERRILDTARARQPSPP